jgi:hypothetical protein
MFRPALPRPSPAGDADRVTTNDRRNARSTSASRRHAMFLKLAQQSSL